MFHIGSLPHAGIDRDFPLLGNLSSLPRMRGIDLNRCSLEEAKRFTPHAGST